MDRLYPALLEAASASIFLIPYLLYQRKNDKNSLFTAMLILFTVYLSTVYAIAGLPTVFYIRYCPNLNSIPFLYMFSDHTASLLNVLLFIPFGIFLPILWTRFQNLFFTLLSGFSLSAAIEFLQLFTYRATDINDLITNTAGTVLGYLIGILSTKKVPAFSASGNMCSFGEILFIVFIGMFFIQPMCLKVFTCIF